MIKFISKKIAVNILDNGLREVRKDFQAKITYKKESFLVIVPRGFLTDMASVPKIFWNLLAKDDPEYLKSALVHDWIYFNQGFIPVVNKRGQDENLNLKRSEADIYFREGAKVLGASWMKRNSIYWAVRMGGRSAWDSHARKKKIEFKMSAHKNPDARMRA